MNIFKKLSYFVASLIIPGVMLLGVATPAGAIDVLSDSCNAGGNGNAVCDAKNDDAMVTVKNVINMLLFILGVIAVISIIIGGIMYTTSNGDQGNVKRAKDTIMYAVIGLVVAILAFAIVTFVVSNVG